MRALDPDDPLSAAAITEVDDLRRERKYNQAIAAGEDRLAFFARLKDAPLELTYLVAVCYYAKGNELENDDYRQARFKKAEKHIRAALERMPNDPRYLSLLDDIVLRQGHLAEAKEHFGMVLAQQPHHPNGLKGMIRVHMAEGNYALAQRGMTALSRQIHHSGDQSFKRTVSRLQAEFTAWGKQYMRDHPPTPSTVRGPRTIISDGNSPPTRG
jgi:predicted Zn-dependent protease